MINTVLLGDCLELMSSLENSSIDMILCDLPYGTTRNKWDSVIPLDALWKQYERVIKDNGAICLTAAQPFTSILVASNLKYFKYEWIWQKEAGTGLLNAKKQPLRDHESVLVFYKKQCTYNPQFSSGKPYIQKKGGDTSNYNKSGIVVTENPGIRYPKTVLKFPRDRNKIHPTQKPVALLEYLIKTYSNPGQLVLDNCIGSGSTAIACRNTARNFIGMEKDREIYKMCLERLDTI